MKVKGYGAWPPWNVSQGGKPYSFDPYNRAMKGGERFPGAEEYADKDMPEYYTWSREKDASEDVPQDGPEQQKQQEFEKAKQKARARSNLLKQVVGLVAGSTVLVTSYQASVALRSQDAELPPDGPAIVEPGTGSEGESGSQSEGGDQTDSRGEETTPQEEQTTPEKTVPEEQTVPEETAPQSGAAANSAAGEAGTAEEGEIEDGSTASYCERKGHNFKEISGGAPGTIRFRCTKCGQEMVVTYSLTPET